MRAALDRRSTMVTSRRARARRCGRSASAAGARFVPYVTGGLPGVDAALLRGARRRRSRRDRGRHPVLRPRDGRRRDPGGLGGRAGGRARTRPTSSRRSREAAIDVPVAVMTYVNPVFRRGFEPFLPRLEEAGRRGGDRPGPAGGRDRGVDRGRSAAHGDRRRPARRARHAARAARGDRRRQPRVRVLRRDLRRDGRAATSLSGTARRASSTRCARSRTCRCWWASGSPRRSRPVAACAFADGVIVGYRPDGPMVGATARRRGRRSRGRSARRSRCRGGRIRASGLPRMPHAPASRGRPLWTGSSGRLASAGSDVVLSSRPGTDRGERGLHEATDAGCAAERARTCCSHWSAAGCANDDERHDRWRHRRRREAARSTAPRSSSDASRSGRASRSTSARCWRSAAPTRRSGRTA